MKILICGGRFFGNFQRTPIDDPTFLQSKREYIFGMNYLESYYGHLPITVVISGMASGADTIGIAWAEYHGYPVESYYPDWSKGKIGGLLRNEKMLKEGKPDLVIAFPGNTGTAHMVKISKTAKVKVDEVRYGETLVGEELFIDRA